MKTKTEFSIALSFTLMVVKLVVNVKYCFFNYADLSLNRFAKLALSQVIFTTPFIVTLIVFYMMNKVGHHT